MMKKIFIVLMALAICGTANASIVSLVGEGTTIVAAPGTVQILINTDTGLWGLDAIVTVAGGDVISAAMDPTTSAAYGWDPVGFPISPLGVGTASVEEGGGTFTQAGPGNVGFVDVAYTGGTQVVSILGGFTFGGSMDIGGGAPVFSTGTVTIIPEPITIALLGLGGLFLRRRK